MLHKAHRSIAVFLCAFIVVHLVNHLVAISGVTAHMEFMESARRIYRHPLLEPILLTALGMQIVIGLMFVYRTWGQRVGFFPKIQALSGCYLAFFLIAHVGATLNARITLGLDTNIYFAAAGIHAANLSWFFVPYYFLAVLAVFGHVASATHWFLSRQRTSALATQISGAVILLGVLLASLITLVLSGAFYDFEIPESYGTIFSALPS